MDPGTLRSRPQRFQLHSFRPGSPKLVLLELILKSVFPEFVGSVLAIPRVRKPSGKIVRLLVPFISCGLLCCAALGCEPCRTHGLEPEEYAEGIVSARGTVYETSHPSEELLPFPSGQTYDLLHGLGTTPTSVHGYLSFVPRLTESGDPYDRQTPNNLAEAAGNQMVIERWDDEVIRIRNDTCADFYVRVVAYAEESGSSMGGAAGASSN